MKIPAEFIKGYLRILQEALRHTDEKGYLHFELDNNFYLVDNSLEVIRGDFDREEFNITEHKTPQIPEDMELDDAFYVYLSALGADYKTRWNFRKLIYQLRKKPTSVIQSLQ